MSDSETIFPETLPKEGQNQARPSPWPKTFVSLRNRNYRWFWLGLLASNGGMQMQQLARGWLVYQMTDSPLALGLVSAGWGIPILLLSLFGGVVADRVEKRSLIMMTQSAAFIITLFIAILIATGLIQFWHLLAYSSILGVFYAFNMPVRQAAVSELVPENELFNAIALSSSAMNLMRIAAPALAGVLVGVIGVAGVYFLVVACYALAILSLSFVPTMGTADRDRRSSVIGDLAEGLNYIRNSPLILIQLMMVFIFVLFGFPYQQLLPVFTVDVLRVGADGLGWLMAASGVGALVGSLTIASLTDLKRKGLLPFASAMAFGVSLIAFSNSGSLYLSLFLLLFVGAAGNAYMALNNTVIQANASQEVRGRVMSVYMMTFGLMPLGVLPISAVATVVGAPLALSLSVGIFIALAIVITTFNPNLRGLK